MIYSNDAADIREGDYIVSTKKVIKKTLETGLIEFVLDDGSRITHVQVDANRTLEVSNYPIVLEMK